MFALKSSKQRTKLDSRSRFKEHNHDLLNICAGEPISDKLLVLLDPPVKHILVICFPTLRNNLVEVVLIIEFR